MAGIFPVFRSAGSCPCFRVTCSDTLSHALNPDMHNFVPRIPPADPVWSTNHASDHTSKIEQRAHPMIICSNLRNPTVNAFPQAIFFFCSAVSKVWGGRPRSHGDLMFHSRILRVQRSEGKVATYFDCDFAPACPKAALRVAQAM